MPKNLCRMSFMDALKLFSSGIQKSVKLSTLPTLQRTHIVDAITMTHGGFLHFPESQTRSI